MQDLGGTRSLTFGTAGTNTRYLFYVPTGINDPKVAESAAILMSQLEAPTNESSTS